MALHTFTYSLHEQSNIASHYRKHSTAARTSAGQSGPFRRRCSLTKSALASLGDLGMMGYLELAESFWPSCDPIGSAYYTECNLIVDDSHLALLSTCLSCISLG